jgi:hypothetical protein
LKKISDRKVRENSIWKEKTQNVMLISKPVGKLQKKFWLSDISKQYFALDISYLMCVKPNQHFWKIFIARSIQKDGKPTLKNRF